MNSSLLLLPALSVAIASMATAQTGRTMKLMAPVVLGHTASFVLEHPPAIAGHPFAMAMCSPSHPGALPLSIPGVVEGVLRLDPLAYGVLGSGVLDATGQSPALTFAIPSDPLLVGASFDVQGADLDAMGLITLTDNDLEIEVSEPPSASLNMVAIAPGSFAMGSGAYVAQQPWTAVELPVHSVAITQPFWIGQFEVMQAEYQGLMGSNPSFFLGANQPVERVSWYDAVAYCDALTVQEAAAGRLPSGYEYRLPTEAEWEYCCRAGTITEWHAGLSLSCQEANFYDFARGLLCVGQTSPVSSYASNAWGLHDMHGNVWEWCLDGWDGSANYPAASVSDPFVSTGPLRVLRGGSWDVFEGDCRSANRYGFSPGTSRSVFGFRVVCAPLR